MKKSTKILSVFMVVAVLVSLFSIAGSAVSLTKEEILDQYHQMILETSKQSDVFGLENDWKFKETADLSALTEKDKKETTEWFETSFEGKWEERYDETYCYGFDESEEYNDFYEYFEVDFWIDEEIKTLTDAQLTENADGSVTIKFMLKGIELNTTEVFTAEFSAEGYLTEWTTTCVDIYELNSIKDSVPFEVRYELYDHYIIIRNDVPVETLTLSDYELTMGYGETKTITYEVGPVDASIKSVYVETTSFNEETEMWEDNYDVVSAYVENGVIYIEAIGEGTVDVDVITCSGKILESCTVTVEYTIFDKIAEFFEMIIWYIQLVFSMFLPW